MGTIIVHLLLAWQPPGAPDAGESRYVPIPFSGDVADVLRQQLQRSKDQAPARRLLDQLRRDFGDFKVPKDLLDKVDLNNPAIRQLMQNYADKLTQGGKLDLNDAQRIAQDLRKIAPPNIDFPIPPMPPPGRQPPPIMPGPPARPNPPPNDLERNLRNFVRNAERSDVGERLRRSPAWNKAVTDLNRFLQTRPGQSGIGLNDLARRLNLPGNLDLKIGDGLLSKVRNLSLPDLPNIQLPQIDIGRWTPNLGGGPSLPSISGAGLLQSGVWILLAVILVVLVYQILLRVQWPRGTSRLAMSIGPCPIKPDQISTRTQLRQAFEYLALLHLGPEARPCNHKAIARRLEAAPRTGTAGAAVQALTNLYEMARYTHGEEILAPAEQAAARQSMLVLAGQGNA